MPNSDNQEGDIFFEQGLNKPTIGAKNGNFFAGYVSVLLRYQLAGYAWGKALLENPGFLVEFNRELFAQAVLDPDVLSSESKLIAIAGAIQQTVEGNHFARWYAQQYVLNTSPPAGYWLFNRVNQFTIDYFLRSSDGSEIMLTNAWITHASYNSHNLLFDSGSEVTSAFGWVSSVPRVPKDYTGRIQIIATATSREGSAQTNVAFCYIGPELGVFGVVSQEDSGSVEFTPLDAAIQPVRVDIVNGAFSETSLAEIKGRFIATFTSQDGYRISKQFTKDASDYFLPLSTTGNVVNLTVSQAATTKKRKGKTVVTYIVAVSNASANRADDIVLLDSLPSGATLLSVTPSTGIYSVTSVPINGLLTVNWDMLPAGAGATITVVVAVDSPLPSAVTNETSICSASLDLNIRDNASKLVVSLLK